MDTILDLTDSENDHELLTSTEVDTRLRNGTLLADRSLDSYLRPEEEPKYVLRNRNAGVEFERDGQTTTVQPDDGYQALALVTDVRVYFVTGRDAGNRTIEVALSDVVQAKQTDSGFRTSNLVIETLDGRRWSFACRGDTSEVASLVDGHAQVWAHAQRLADDAEDQLRTAREHLDAGQYRAGADALDGVEEMLETAVDRLCGAGDGACAHIRARVESLARQLFDLEGPVYAHTAAGAHASAQDAWRNRDYEAAARAYDRAIDQYAYAINSYERASEARDTRESDQEAEIDRLCSRLAGAVGEQELLRVAPLSDAEAARRRASAIDDPAVALEQWDGVLNSYPELLDLEWDGDGEFAFGPARVRERASAAAAGAIDDYYEEGRRQLGYGDQFATDGQADRAAEFYEQASEQFERARQIASQARSDRVEEMESALVTVENRLAGFLPAEPTDDDLPTTETETDPPAVTTGDGSAPSGTNGDDERPSVIDRLQSRADATESTGGSVRGAGESSDRSVRGTGESTGGALTDTEFQTELRSLDGTAFTRLVADLWEALGWSTTVYSATNQVVHDVVATRGEPEQRRLLLWTEHRPDGTRLDPQAIEQCATARDSSQGADSATVVTNALVRTAARQRAQQLDVTIVGGPSLIDLVQFEGLLDRLIEETTDA